MRVLLASCAAVAVAAAAITGLASPGEAAPTAAKDQILDLSDQMADPVLAVVNDVRKAHRAPPLTKLTDDAYTRERARAKVGHPLSYSPPSADPKYGEIVFRVSGKDLNLTAKQIVGAWYKNANTYGYSKENPDSRWLCLTQLVWADSTQAAVAVMDRVTDKDHYTVVMDFLPRGNLKDQYKKNVKPVLGRVAPPLGTITAEDQAVINSAETLGLKK